MNIYYHVILSAIGLTGSDPTAARATIEAKGEVWVGQRVPLRIELRTPGFFADAPAFDIPRVPGVILVGPAGSPTLGSDTVDGVSVTTQRHEIAVYAQRPGRIEIPGISIRFESSAAYGKPSVAHAVTTAAVSYEARMPPGAEGLSTVVTTSKFTLHEEWKPEPGTSPIRLGSAFVRTITTEAQGVPGMVLPSFLVSPPEGISAYPKEPAVEDRADRGESTGRRIDTVTYVFKSPGRFTVPALALSWWDPEKRALHHEELPARSFEVEAPPAPAAGKPDPPQHASWMGVVATLTCFLGLGLATWRFGPAIRTRWAGHRQRIAAIGELPPLNPWRGGSQ